MKIVWVEIARILAIFLIVAHHVINETYSLNTSEVNALSPVFAKLGLGAFTFISGYFALDTLVKKSAVRIIKDKFVRLMMPALIYGLIFFCICGSMAEQGDPVNGTPLWYLPMLFLCFVLLAVVRGSYERNWKFVIIITSGFALLGVGLALKGEAWMANVIPLSWEKPMFRLKSYFPLFMLGLSVAAYGKNPWYDKFIGSVAVTLCLVANFVVTGILWLPSMIFVIVVAMIFKSIHDSDACVFLGRMTFPIYLCHQVVINVLIRDLKIFDVVGGGGILQCRSSVDNVTRSYDLGHN